METSFLSYYPGVFKRKSFHLFHGKISFNYNDLSIIEEMLKHLVPLHKEIETEIVLVPSSEVDKSRGADYALLFYSEEKPGYLENVGYLGEQLDLSLTLAGFGTLWFGIGRPKRNPPSDKKFVIMILFSKMPEESFRKDLFKAKRKTTEEIWQGDKKQVGDLVRFSPSACNLQPWFVRSDASKIHVFRIASASRRGIMPKEKVAYYQAVDLGIFLCILETILYKEKLHFERSLIVGEAVSSDLIPIATYKMEK